MCKKLHKALIVDEFIKDLEDIKESVEKIDLINVQWYESATEKARQQSLPAVLKKIVKWRKRRSI